MATDITIVDILLHPVPLHMEQSRWQERIRGAESLIVTLEAQLEYARTALEGAIWPTAIQAGSVILAKASLELADASHYLERLYYEAEARGCGEKTDEGDFVWYDSDRLHEEYKRRRGGMGHE